MTHPCARGHLRRVRPCGRVCAATRAARAAARVARKADRHTYPTPAPVVNPPANPPGAAVRRHRPRGEFHRQYGDARPGRIHGRPACLRSGRAQRDLAHAHRRTAGVWRSRARPAADSGTADQGAGCGESAFIPGGTYHWHGAAPNENFTMMFVTMGQSKTSQGEPVTEEVYLGKKK